jgi:pantoate kinase
MTDQAQAFVPGHVTGFFTSDPDPDPVKTGSRGGGLALSDGVTVSVRPADETAVFLGDVSVEMGAVGRVLDALGVSAQVRTETDLSPGVGFGVSGAVALGAALAANQVFDCRLSENELVTIAHGAEVQAGTGLGDVVAQARGGVPLRLEPGGPQVNKLDAIPARTRVEYVVRGELDTAEILGGDTAALTAAGEQAIAEVVSEPTLETFMRASRRFSREAGLLTEGVREIVTDVTEAGGTATMAMLGQTVIALDTGLSDAGYDPSVCHVHSGGATVLAAED